MTKKETLTLHERKVRAQKDHDTEWLIAGLFGVALMILAFVGGVASTAAGRSPSGVGFFFFLGLILFVAGLIMRGRPVR